MTAPTLDLAAGYTAQQQLTRNTILAYLMVLWARLTSYRDTDASAFATQAATAVTGGQQHIAAITAAHLGWLIRAGGGTPGTAPVGTINDQVLRGVPALDVYQRPFRQIWWDLSQNKPLPDAVSSARTRLRSLAVTDLQLAKTTTAQHVLGKAQGVTGYRRVLNGASSCALCVLAATRTYRKAALLPIHSGCDCSVAPLFDHERAPDVTADLHNLVAQDLGEKYVNYSGSGYRDLVVTHDHGELGPVLTVRGEHFQGPPS